MIETLPGTPIASLSANGGENHLDGWTFNIVGDGKYDNLFDIANSTLVVGTEYIPPGNLSVNVEAFHSTYGTYIETLYLQIVDFGRFPTPTTRIYTPPNHFLPHTSTYEVLVSFKYSVALPSIDVENVIFKFDEDDIVALHTDGSITFASQGIEPGVTLPAGTVSLNVGTWYTFRMVREDRGSGLKTYYELNGDLLNTFTFDPMIDFNKFTPCHIASGSDAVEVSNTRVKLDGDVYVQEEFKTGIGIFIHDGSWEYTDQVVFDLGPLTSFEYASDDTIVWDIRPMVWEYEESSWSIPYVLWEYEEVNGVEIAQQQMLYEYEEVMNA